MSSAQKFKELLKKKSEEVDDPSIMEKWVEDVAELYKIITEWLNEEGFESFINPEEFEDPSIGKYSSNILIIRAGGSEATIEPRYTMLSSHGHGAKIVSGKERGLRVENLVRVEVKGESRWMAAGPFGSPGKVLTKDRFFDLLIYVFGLEG